MRVNFFLQDPDPRSMGFTKAEEEVMYELSHNSRATSVATSEPTVYKGSRQPAGVMGICHLHPPCVYLGLLSRPVLPPAWHSLALQLSITQVACTTLPLPHFLLHSDSQINALMNDGVARRRFQSWCQLVDTPLQVRMQKMPVLSPLYSIGSCWVSGSHSCPQRPVRKPLLPIPTPWGMLFVEC